MNKYQEALNHFFKTVTTLRNKYVVINNQYDANKFELYKEQRNTLQELVDKETPFKPNNIRVNSEERYGTCKCLSIVFENNYYCKKCGQAIDWSE